MEIKCTLQRFREIFLKKRENLVGLVSPRKTLLEEPKVMIKKLKRCLKKSRWENARKERNK